MGVKLQSNFFLDKEIKFNNSERKVVIAGHIENPNLLQVGIAIFNPSDDYSQELGKKIALGRAKKDNHKTIQFWMNHDFTSKKQILSLMESALIQVQDNVKEFAPFAIRRRKKKLEETKVEETIKQEV